MWDLSYNFNAVMFEDAKQCTYDVLILSKALYCRYAQDAQHVDQNNCRRVPRLVCPVLLTVEGHWQRRCKWGCFAYVAELCARCHAVWEALTKALKLRFCGFVLVSVRLVCVLDVYVWLLFFLFFEPAPLILFMGYKQCIKANEQYFVSVNSNQKLFFLLFSIFSKINGIQTHT